MRLYAAAIVFLSVVAGSAQSVVDDSRIAFSGVTLQIGESQETAIAALRRYYQVEQAPKIPGAFVITPLGTAGGPGGSVTFKDGKLMAAFVNWLTSDQQTKGVPFAEALYGAVRQVTGAGRSCAVQATTTQDPHLEQKAVSIVCGGLQIWINVFKDGSGMSAELDTVLGAASVAK